MVNKLGLIKTIYGAGGRSSNSGLSVAVFGAYGFVGRYLVNDLGKNLYHVLNYRIINNIKNRCMWKSCISTFSW
jgi:hypothetical protein